MIFQVKYKKHKRANGNGTNGKSSSNPSTPGPPQTIPSSTSGMDLDPFRRPRSESSGSGMDTSKFMINAETVMTTCGLTPITTLPAVTSSPLEMYHNPNKGLLGGVNILRAALTGSNDVRIPRDDAQFLRGTKPLFLFRYLSNTKIWVGRPRTSTKSTTPSSSMSSSSATSSTTLLLSK